MKILKILLIFCIASLFAWKCLAQDAQELENAKRQELVKQIKELLKEEESQKRKLSETIVSIITEPEVAEQETGPEKRNLSKKEITEKIKLLLQQPLHSENAGQADDELVEEQSVVSDDIKQGYPENESDNVKVMSQETQFPVKLKTDFWAEARGSYFLDENVENDLRGNVRALLRTEGNVAEIANGTFSAVFEAGTPSPDIYEESVAIWRSDGKKSNLLLQEAFIGLGNDFKLKVGRFRPEFNNEVKFDFIKLSPFTQLDSSEPFLSLDDDRLLGSWGGMLGYYSNRIGIEFIAFAHEDPILATHPDDFWARQLPYQMSYGSFESGTEIDWGARLSGNWWELSFFKGSSNSPNHLQIGEVGKLNLIFPEQTSLEGAVELPAGPFNFRAGAIHNWRRWEGENAGQFLSGIAELEFLGEGIFRHGDNLLWEVGFADVWDTAESDFLQEGLGIDQIYRGASLLFTVEYSPIEDWVFKVRSIWNIENDSVHISPEVRKFLFTKIGEWELFLRGMIIDGSSDDVISGYSDNDNFELGIRFNF